VQFAAQPAGLLEGLEGPPVELSEGPPGVQQVGSLELVVQVGYLGEAPVVAQV